ncbi:MAG TPA: ABC transporter permease [Gemmatimonadales bacterium]|jgi:ABC-2 type transport system permease protein|nr:ABC transporter permease [Gemmatimonadales bacterium]
MNKIFAIVRREFIERVRRPLFWVMALVGPVLFGGLMVIPALLIGRGTLKHIAIVDASHAGLGKKAAALFDTSKVQGVLVSPGPRVDDSLQAAVSARQLDGFLLIGDALVDSGKAEYRASNVSSFTTNGEIESTLQRVASQVKLEREGIDTASIRRAGVHVDLATHKIAGGKVTEESAGQSFSLAYFMGIILYISILLYGINVMSSVLEEKTTRIVEVLISSVRPFELMLGKVIGTGAVSLFQFLIWGVTGRWIYSMRHQLGADTESAGMPFQVPHVSADTAAIFLAYFLGGFMLYSAMFAAVGAISSNEQEARQAQQPVSMLLILSYISMFGMLNDPNSTYAVTLSLIPFTSPIAMPVRWAAGNLPIREVIISLALLIIGILGVTWVAARIYRVGILMTGKRPNPKELLRWIRTA